MKVQVLYKVFLWFNTNTGTMRIFEIIAEKVYVDCVLSEERW